jgi:hypothetical protein
MGDELYPAVMVRAVSQPGAALSCCLYAQVKRTMGCFLMLWQPGT